MIAKDATIGGRMRAVLDLAADAESKRRHNFGATNRLGVFHERTASPKRSACGLFYLDCRACGRAVIEGLSGSASTASCGA